MPKALVIVESPAKSKTINKILGKDFSVIASMGHMIDLPKSRMAIDVNDNFKPEYIVIPERRKYLASIKKEAKKKDIIYLAADPDREGEAISWHLKNQFDDKKIKIYRVTFDEITEKAVKTAFKNPRDIDMNLVSAQQTRRILDRIVGYSISPILWLKVTRGLSAGRVQSVAVRLIVDRENEIRAFKPVEYWDIEAILKKKSAENELDSVPFTAKLDKIDGKKAELNKKEDTDVIVKDLENAEYIVTDIDASKKKKKPIAPFTTSKLQQEAFNKLRYPVNRTMRIAQGLYEGVELGDEGQIGLITYMRTDSVRVSDDARSEAKEYVLAKFGNRYYPETPNVYKSKKSAQEAHESIRPTLPLREPESVRQYLEPDAFKLYELIWNRFISSQMKEAIYSMTKVLIKAGRCVFKATGSHIEFDGFMALYREAEDEDKELSIPRLSKEEMLDLVKLVPDQHFTKPPARYSDASLVKVLEEQGVGRPSTYAPTISTIIDRIYVNRQNGYLHPTELGETVVGLLVKHFPQILDIEFTAEMEEKLDDIEQGKVEAVDVLSKFYKPFAKTVEAAKSDMKSVKKEAVKTDEMCPQCGKVIVIKWGKRGKFLSCSAFPACKFAKSITTKVKCPSPGCTGELIERRSRRGAFYGCTKYPACTFITKKLPSADDAALDPAQADAAVKSPEGDTAGTN